MHLEERTLDISKRNTRSGQTTPIILRRGEANQTQIKVNFTSNGEPYAVGSLKARFCALLENKTFVLDSAHVATSTNSATYTVQSDLTSAPGDVRIAYFELASTDNVLTSDSIPIIVLDNVEFGDAPAQEYKNTIDKMIEELEDSLRKSNDMLSNVESAASDASKAAQNANSAAERVETAISNAESATKDAEGAAKEAIDAADKASQLNDAFAEAEKQRQANESERISAEEKRALEQAKNNADQAINNAKALQQEPYICNSSEYDPNTLTPNIEEPVSGRMYLVPTGAVGDDKYIEWQYINNDWERIGTKSGGEISIMTTDQIDQAFDGGFEGDQVISASGLTYFIAKIKTWASGVFRKVADLIKEEDIADGAVNTTKIAANAVTSAKISSGAVGSTQLASSAVTNEKLAGDAVTTDKIKNGTILMEDMSQNFQDDYAAVKKNAADAKSAWDSASSYNLENSFKFFVFGKIGVITVYRVAQLASSSEFSYLSKLPDGYRPISDLYFPMHGAGSGVLTPVNGYIGVDGRIGINQSSGSTVYNQAGCVAFMLA